MHSKEIVHGWLREIDDQFGLDENGSSTFEYANQLKVGIEVSDNGTAHLYAIISSIPDDDLERAKLYERLLKLNVFGDQTDGASFAIHEATNAILLCYNVAVEHYDAQLFENTLGNFVDAASRWHAEINNTVEGENTETPDDNNTLDISSGGFMRV